MHFQEIQPWSCPHSTTILTWLFLLLGAYPSLCPTRKNCVWLVIVGWLCPQPSGQSLGDKYFCLLTLSIARGISKEILHRPCLYPGQTSHLEGRLNSSGPLWKPSLTNTTANLDFIWLVSENLPSWVCRLPSQVNLLWCLEVLIPL